MSTPGVGGSSCVRRQCRQAQIHDGAISHSPTAGFQQVISSSECQQAAPQCSRWCRPRLLSIAIKEKWRDTKSACHFVARQSLLLHLLCSQQQLQMASQQWQDAVRFLPLLQQGGEQLDGMTSIPLADSVGEFEDAGVA